MTQPFAVVTWRHANAGGESLVFHYTPNQPFAVVTGPSPWGAGSWGPFPPEAIIGVRRLRKADAWPVSGCSSQRWTANDVLAALKRNRTGFPDRDRNIGLLETAIAQAE